MLTTCKNCSNQFEPNERARKRVYFCSSKCKRQYFRAQIVDVTCLNCKKSRKVTYGTAHDKKKNNQCQSCSSDKNSGVGSGTWKGGFKYWSPGRFGKDKDGLSWKIQRRLAWERDDFTCQHCHKKKNRKPDVHHISPWMNSHSHALDNLVCLCKSCHLKEEGKK